MWRSALITSLAVGVAAAASCTLAVAAVVKSVELDLTRRSVGRLVDRRIPRRWLTVCSVMLCSIELVVAIGLMIRPLDPPVLVSAVALSGGFVAVVKRAQRRGVACGCFGSFSVRTSGFVESLRAVSMLVGLGATLVVAAAAGNHQPSWQPRLAGIAGAGGFAAILAIVERRGGGADRASKQAAVAWVRMRPAARRRHLRHVAAHPVVADVVRRMGIEVAWRTANVRVTEHQAVHVSVRMGQSSITVLSTGSGDPLVLGLTPKGIITPARLAGTSLQAPTLTATAITSSR